MTVTIDEAIQSLERDTANFSPLAIPDVIAAERLGIEALKLLKSADFSGGAHTFKGQSVEECIFIRKSDLKVGPFADLIKQ